MERELIALVASSNVLEVRNLKNAVSGALVDATGAVSVTVTDKDGTELAGQAWPLALGYISPGLFRGVLPAALPLVAGIWYEVLLTATQSGLTLTRRLPLVARDS